MSETTRNTPKAPSPASQVMDIMAGFWSVQVMSAASALGIPELLAGAPKSYRALAEATGANPRALFRLLRAMTSLGLCQHEGDAFALTDAGNALRKDVPGSVRSIVMYAAGDQWRAWADLETVVRTGRPAPSVGTGAQGFADFATQPELAAMFNQSMVDGSKRTAEEALGVYDFSRFGCIMDVGGGYGAVLGVLLNANAAQRGIVYDLPYLATRTTDYLNKVGVGGRAQFIGGDFFQSIPAGADCYVLKYIIHDWVDERALTILRNCRKAAGEGGTLILIERVVPERMEALPAHRAIVGADLLMMAYGGEERTEKEFRDLLDRAGFSLIGIAPLPSGLNVIEAVARG